MKRCPYPNCVLEEHEDGEHRIGRPEKPWGSLRPVSTFCYGQIRCDLHFPHRAFGFYADMLGFGWALCLECVQQYTQVEETAPPAAVAAEVQTPAAEPASPRPASCRVFTMPARERSGA